MRLSQYFFKTLKEIPNDADLKSHRLLLRGGYIRQVGAGIFTYFPIAWRALKKIEAIIREEMDAIGGHEVNMPVAMPATLWQETGRYEAVGDELLRFTDRTGRKMVLGMTHEEAVTDLARAVINSYKQLPMMLYQIQTKFRDEPRVRGGLIRVREFVMKDAYSFHASQADLERYYEIVHAAYARIFARCGLPAISVASDVGMMGGSGAHEFMAVTEAGEDTLVLCPSCDYKANREVAKAARPYVKDAPLPMETVATPGKSSIEDVAAFLGVRPDQTLKAVIYDTGDERVLAVIRGDLEVNEIKLKNYLKTKLLVFASDEQLAAAGLVPGYATPIGARIRVVADESVAKSSNLVAGANKIGFHVKNVNFSRDFATEEIVDIAAVKEGEPCPSCGAPLRVTRGIEVGNIFKLGVKYSKAMGAVFLNEQGKTNDIIMGCYGIGVGRLLASVVETVSTDGAVSWPISVAPFEIELVGIALDKDERVRNACESFYENGRKLGFEILFDDRPASPGFKLADADLVGSPIRVVIGGKSLEAGGAELRVGLEEKRIVPLDGLIAEIQKVRNDLFAKLPV